VLRPLVMNKKEKIWWEELADQYEDWAENPPIDPSGREMFTCDDLVVCNWGFDSNHYPSRFLRDIWFNWIDDPEFPAGEIFDYDRDECRFEFCWLMAETIRDHIGGERNG